ncbi:MAG: SET domain-containing protein [Acidobacteriota bacterium]
MDPVQIVNDKGYFKVVTQQDVAVSGVIFACSPDELTAERTLRTIQVDEHTHLQNHFLDFVNHACAPTSIFDPERLAFVALKPLSVGDEVTFFYPGTETHLAHEFTCNCSHRECLGYIVGGLDLTVKQMRAALDRGLCTPVIARQLEAAVAGAVAEAH